MMTLTDLGRRLIALMICVCLSTSGAGAVWAQTLNNDTGANRVFLAAVSTDNQAVSTELASLGFDITAPTITHSPSISKGIAGEVQSIVAEISDNSAVERALLVYRTSSADFYSTVDMTADLNSTTWLATIDTNAQDTLVHYYIVAEDTDGNRVQKGSESNPLSLQLQQPELFSAITPLKRNNQTNWLGIGLGIFVVGALLASTGGSGSGGGITNSDGNNNCCTVTFVVENVSTE